MHIKGRSKLRGRGVRNQAGRRRLGLLQSDSCPNSCNRQLYCGVAATLGGWGGVGGTAKFLDMMLNTSRSPLQLSLHPHPSLKSTNCYRIATERTACFEGVTWKSDGGGMWRYYVPDVSKEHVIFVFKSWSFFKTSGTTEPAKQRHVPVRQTPW